MQFAQALRGFTPLRNQHAVQMLFNLQSRCEVVCEKLFRLFRLRSLPTQHTAKIIMDEYLQHMALASHRAAKVQRHLSETLPVLPALPALPAGEYEEESLCVPRSAPSVLLATG